MDNLPLPGPPNIPSVLSLSVSSGTVAWDDVTPIGSRCQLRGGHVGGWVVCDAGCWQYVSRVGREYSLPKCYPGTSTIDLDAAPVHEDGFASNLQSLPDFARLVRSHLTISPKTVSHWHPTTVADGYNSIKSGSHNSATGFDLIDPRSVGECLTVSIRDWYSCDDTRCCAAIDAQGFEGRSNQKDMKVCGATSGQRSPFIPFPQLLFATFMVTAIVFAPHMTMPVCSMLWSYF